MQWPHPFGHTGAASAASTQPQPGLTIAAQAARQLLARAQQVQQIQQQRVARTAQQTEQQQQARSTPTFSLSQPQPAAAALHSTHRTTSGHELRNRLQAQPAMPAATGIRSDNDGAAAAAALAHAAPAAPAITRPSITGSLGVMRHMLQGSVESVAGWLLNQLRPALLNELSPQLSAADRAARRAQLLLLVEEKDGFTLLVNAMNRCAKEAVAQLAVLLQQPTATAMQPSTASQRAAAAASTTPVQVSTCDNAGKGAAKAKLKASLLVLNALVGPEGALRLLLLSDSGSAVDLPAQPLCWIFTLFAASTQTFFMVKQLLDALHKLHPVTSKFQLEATFEPLHDLRCHAVVCEALQLLWAVMSRRHDQLQQPDHIKGLLERMWEQAKVINMISEDAAAAATQPRTRWSEHMQLLLPSDTQRLELQIHMAACMHALYGVPSSVGSLSTATDHSRAAAGLLGSPSQPSADGPGSQSMDDSTQPEKHTTAPAGPDSANSAAQLAASRKARKDAHDATLHVIKALCSAIQYARNERNASALAQRAQKVSKRAERRANIKHSLQGRPSCIVVVCCACKLLLLVSEISLQLASSLRSSPGLLLTTLSYLNDHLLPLLFGVLSDPSAHLQLLQIGWRMVLTMMERVASTGADEAQSMAAEIKRSGAIHAILGHCQRITDPSKEAELMYRDGLRPRDALPTALELLAVLVARTAHTPFESTDPKAIEQALGQNIRRFSWERLCQDALTAIAAGTGAAACVHLTLLIHWLESYTSSELFASNQAELSMHALGSLLEHAITTMTARLDKPQLLRICQLIIVSEQRYETCLPERTRRSFFKACRGAQLNLGDCSDAVWSWLWGATFTEAKDLQVDMLVSQLLETVADEDLPAHLQKTAEKIAAAGPNGIRALTRFLENLGNQFASQVDQPYLRSFKQIGVRAVTVLYFLLPLAPLRSDSPDSALQVMSRMCLKDAFGKLLSKGWHRVGMQLDTAASPTALLAAEIDETAERTLLQLHRQLVALCAAIVRQENPVDPGCTRHGFQSAMQVIANSVLELFQSHLAEAVADHELHLDIMQLLPLMLSYDERGTLLQLASSRAIAILQGSTAHVPACNDLPSIDQLSLLFKAIPGLVGVAPEDVEAVQSLQAEMQIHLLQLLARIIPAARRFNDDAESSSDMHTAVDARSFAHITNVQQLTFMLASPLLDLRGAAFALLSCFLRERLIEFDAAVDDDDDGQDDVEGLTANGANGVISRSALHLSFIDARKIMLAVQNTMQQTMHHEKLQALADAAVSTMQLLLQSGPAEWSTPLLRLPWNGFLLRAELGHLADSKASLPPAFLHFLALTSVELGWARETRQWIRPEPTLQALQRLFADAPASVEMIQHALHLLQALKDWPLLEGELGSLAQSVLVTLRDSLEKHPRSEEVNAVGASDAASAAELRAVADKIDALGRALASTHSAHSQANGSQDVPMESSQPSNEQANGQADPAVAPAAASAAAVSSPAPALVNDSVGPRRSMDSAVVSVPPSSSSPSPMDTSADEPPKSPSQQLDSSPTVRNGASADSSAAATLNQESHTELSALDSVATDATQPANGSNGLQLGAAAWPNTQDAAQREPTAHATATTCTPTEATGFGGYVSADGTGFAKQLLQQTLPEHSHSLLSFN